MVLNVTYDACKFWPFSASSVTVLYNAFIIANSLHWWDAALNKDLVYNPGDIAWVLASTALVWIMVPGVGFFYSGLLRYASPISEMGFLSIKHHIKGVKMLFQ